MSHLYVQCWSALELSVRKPHAREVGTWVGPLSNPEIGKVLTIDDGGEKPYGSFLQPLAKVSAWRRRESLHWVSYCDRIQWELASQTLHSTMLFVKFSAVHIHFWHWHLLALQSEQSRMLNSLGFKKIEISSWKKPLTAEISLMQTLSPLGRLYLIIFQLIHLMPI